MLLILHYPNHTHCLSFLISWDSVEATIGAHHHPCSVPCPEHLITRLDLNSSVILCSSPWGKVLPFTFLIPSRLSTHYLLPPFAPPLRTWGYGCRGGYALETELPESSGSLTKESYLSLPHGCRDGSLLKIGHEEQGFNKTGPDWASH